MKKLAGIFVLVVMCGFISDKPPGDKPRRQPKLNVETPPGCVWLRDSLFIDEHEVRNLDYLEFLYWTGRNEPEQYDAILPDTLCDRHKLVLCEPYVEYYLRHPAYRDYPVIGVSYEQAVAFCEWRTRMVNRWIYIRESKIKTDKWDTIVNFPERVVYRLPTEEEWCYAAAAGLRHETYPFGYRSLYGKDSLPVSLVKDYDPAKHAGSRWTRRGPSISYADERSPVQWGKPNYYGIYNLPGNVSELVADSLIKGLNFLLHFDGRELREQNEYYLLVDSTASGYLYTFRYTKPQAWLGFRCVCEVRK